jgi:hypothetical protein
MTMPYVRFGLSLKRKAVVKIAIPQRMTITSAGSWQLRFISFRLMFREYRIYEKSGRIEPAL